jgi:hypothetical protein
MANNSCDYLLLPWLKTGWKGQILYTETRGETIDLMNQLVYMVSGSVPSFPLTAPYNNPRGLPI